MYKLEATESKNNYLSMQRKFVKKALAKLTDSLFKQDVETPDNATTENTQRQSRQEADYDTLNDFCRLSLNNKQSPFKQGNNFMEKEIGLGSYFRESKGKNNHKTTE